MVIFTVLFDFKCMHHQPLLQGQTINKDYCLRFLSFLCTIQQRRPDLWRNNSWQLQYLNAPAVSEFWAVNNTVMINRTLFAGHDSVRLLSVTKTEEKMVLDLVIKVTTFVFGYCSDLVLIFHVIYTTLTCIHSYTDIFIK